MEIDRWMDEQKGNTRDREKLVGWLANRWIDWRKDTYVEKKMLERERKC